MSFKTCCILKEQVLIDLWILQIRPTSRSVFVRNPVYIRMHCMFFRWDLIQPQKLSSNLTIWLTWIKLRCSTMTTLRVLMFQMKSLKVNCGYSHPYIMILLEAGTEIHASYVNNLYDPMWRKNGTTIIDTLMQDCIWEIRKILVIHVWHCVVILCIYFSSSVNTKNSTTIIR